jgi:hypothetical protein
MTVMSASTDVATVMVVGPGGAPTPPRHWSGPRTTSSFREDRSSDLRVDQLEVDAVAGIDEGDRPVLERLAGLGRCQDAESSGSEPGYLLTDGRAPEAEVV